jgi:hypothetical protein
MGAMHKDPIGAILQAANPHGSLLIRDAILGTNCLLSDDRVRRRLQRCISKSAFRLKNWFVPNGQLYRDNTYSRFWMR